MSSTNKTVKPSIEREGVGDCEVAVTLYRNGERLVTKSGQWDLVEFLRGWTVNENISSETLEARLHFADDAGVFGALTGSELIQLNVKTTICDRLYHFRIHSIEARTRTVNGTEQFLVNCVSDEFIKNEVTNVFGNSDDVFGKQTEASKLIKTLIKDKKYIGSSKTIVKSEETLNPNTFIATNWRPLDTIYWVMQRSIRKAKKGGTLQNGFAFFETALGFNFQSIDGMIDDINDQDKNDKSDWTKGKAQLYTYTYSPKNMSDGELDQFAITGLVFPDERNWLAGLRHGTWSGFSMGFDPNTLGNSKMGLSSDLSIDAYRYSLKSMWGKMSHLNSSRSINPIERFDEEVKAIIDYPKRVRYTMLPNQIFDKSYKKDKEKNYEHLVELQAYQWLRLESLKSTKLEIRIPGNLDLYAGQGINIVIPSTLKVEDKTMVDKKFSGRYLIAGVTHSSVGLTMQTQLVLLKDSMFAL